MKRRFCITVRGRSGAEYGFSFDTYADDDAVEYWRLEGFDIAEVTNTIPAWAVDMGLTRPWCAVQDAWRFVRLW